MQITTPEQELESGSVIDAQVMSLDVHDPVLWQAFSETLYTKARWLLEYAQNARDVDKQWEFVLPSLLHPFCEFVDNGPSMSKDFMLSRGQWQNRGFCTAFSSTKRDDKKASGGFGIGRLSGPQGTMIECRNEDMVRTYTLIKNERSIPTLNLLSERLRKDDEKVGTTVRVPVSPSQISQVTVDAKRILRFFGLPNIPSPEFLFRGQTWGVTKEDSRSATVVVGGYPFVINFNLIDYQYRNKYPDCGTLLNKGTAVFWIDPSDVDVALNREDLRYSERTCLALLAAEKIAMEELRQTIKDEIAHCQTRWETSLFVQSMFKRLGRSFTSILKNMMHKDVLIGDQWGENTGMLQLPQDMGVQLWSVEFPTYRNSKTSRKSTRQFVVTEGMVIYEEDTTLAPMKRVGDYYEGMTDRPNVLMISGDVAAFEKWLGKDTEKLSTLPYNKATTKGGQLAIDITNCTKFRRTRQYGSYKIETEKPLKTDKVQYWVPMTGASVDLQNFREIMRLDISPDTVYGIPKRYQTLVEPTWVRLDDHLLSKLPTQKKLVAHLTAHEEVKNADKSEYHRFIEHVRAAQKFINDPDVVAFLKSWDENYELYSEDITGVIRACELLGKPLQRPNVSGTTLRDRCTALMTRYRALAIAATYMNWYAVHTKERDLFYEAVCAPRKDKP